ncbi:MAG: hypothetical protein KJ950_12900 [Proteobacteria bacterium]|nr:hypothetical protein [Pseudomonadota bacterium]MBU1687791.1 hypothetical protein [Pseudomonadota bacterium]
MNYHNLILPGVFFMLLVSCGGGSGDGAANGGTSAKPTSEAASENARLGSVETDLLALINEERQTVGKPVLVRDPGLDTIMLWKVAEMASTHDLTHEDSNGRKGEERVRYYGAKTTARCSEIIQWWGGSPSGRVHYLGYFNSPPHHSAYLEEGLYNLGGAINVGIAGLSGTGPAGSQYAGSNGSYTGLIICDTGITIAINPFSE